MAEKQIIYIAAEHIKPHPDNPRKDLGDLTELSESIKKNGILVFEAKFVRLADTALCKISQHRKIEQCLLSYL